MKCSHPRCILSRSSGAPFSSRQQIRFKQSMAAEAVLADHALRSTGSPNAEAFGPVLITARLMEQKNA